MARTRGRRAQRAWAALIASATAIGGLTAGGLPAFADSSASAPVISEHAAVAASAGVYRLPLAEGTVVAVVHEPSGRAVPLRVDAGSTVVAAATGWIRGLLDSDAPGADWVWIEHPNGEYSKYASFDLAPGRAPGEGITAGGELGRTAAPALVWEVVAPAGDGLEWSTVDGAAANAVRVAPRVCDLPRGELRAGRHLAAACRHTAPTAVLPPGPIVVDEGAEVVLDGSGSVDPDGAPLFHRWTAAPFDLPSQARVRFDTSDDLRGIVSLTVHDQVEALADTVSRDLVVRNVPPSVTAVAGGADEGGVGTVRATVTDPGADTLSAQIEWGDGTAPQPVTIAQLEAGVDHAYGDDGDYPVTVTVTDDDGGVGAHAVALRIANLAPAVELRVAGEAVLPGGAFAVLAPGGKAAATARATDAGSDDLVVTWSNGLGRTFLREGGTRDAPLSPAGAAVSATAGTEVQAIGPGIVLLGARVADDDGGVTDVSVRVLVTGTDAVTRSRSRWIQELSGAVSSDLTPAAGGAYLAVADAASSVFSEIHPVTTPGEATAMLSPRDDDPRTQARAELLCAWLAFASGAVSWDSPVSTGPGASVSFAALVTEAEAAISAPATSDARLRDLGADLSRVSSPAE